MFMENWLILSPVKVIFSLLRAQSFRTNKECYNGLLVWRRQTIFFPVPLCRDFFMFKTAIITLSLLHGDKNSLAQ